MRISLNGKLGEIPTLSRNCNLRDFDHKSGDQPYSSTHQIPTWR